MTGDDARLIAARPGSDWVIDLPGWRTTSIILSDIFGSFTVADVYQSVRSGEVDREKYEEI